MSIILENYGSVVQTAAQEELSSKYSFIPTTRVLDVLSGEGWTPAKVQESYTRKEEHKGFQKHIVRLRNPAVKIVNRDNLFPEIVLTNSHNGLASFQIMAGIMRQICTNGLCVADSTFETQKIKHIGYTNEKVLDAIYRVIESVPQISGKIEEFQEIKLSPDEKQIFAESILDIVYDQETWDRDANKQMTAQRLMLPRRTEDREDTLWNTYNRAQERIIKTGLHLVSDKNYRVGTKTRAVKSIDRDIKLNKALWSLTERMAELKR